MTHTQRSTAVEILLVEDNEGDARLAVEIKTDAQLRRIPLVILSASSAEEDIVRSYDLHANCYVVKPLSLERFIEVTRSIEIFWLSIVELPAAEGDV